MATTWTAVYSLLKDTIETVWGIEMPGAEAKSVWKKYMDEKTMDDGWVDDQEVVGPGLMAVKQQGALMALDSVVEGVAKRYTAQTFALRLQISEEVVEDNKYKKAVDWSRMLMNASVQTPDYDCANILNRAFNSSYVGADALSLCNGSHLLTRGGTYANQLSTAMSLSETAIEECLLALRKLVGSDGLIKGYRGKSLIVPPDLEWRARRILKSAQQNDTANNAINAVKQEGSLGEIVVVPYITSTTNWFIKTDCPNGLTWYWRRKPRFRTTNDEIAEVMNVTGSYRADRGWTNPRGIFGSNA